MKIERLLKVLLIICFTAIIEACTASVVVEQQLATGYVNQSSVEKFYVSYQQVVYDELKDKIDLQFRLKIAEINSKKVSKALILRITIDKAIIADKGETLVTGIFSGKNSLHGKVLVYDSKTNNIIGKYRVEVNKNYGGYSFLFDLEEKIVSEFVTQVLEQVNDNM